MSKESMSSISNDEGANVTPHPTGSILEQAKALYRKWLALPDGLVIDFMFGVVFANRLSGDPVWGGIVGASGDTKTELIRSLSHPDIVTLSTLTQNTLLSGLPAHMNKGKEPSLLANLDGKLLVIKDLTPIISGSRDARNSILGDLRDAYDGFSSKAFGTGEHKSFSSRFGLLFGVTPVIESTWSVINQLGERFVYYRCAVGDSFEKVAAALKNSNQKEKMRKDLTAAATLVLNQEMPSSIEIPESIEHRILHLADFVAKARTPVKREGRSEEVEFFPVPEVGTRLGGQLIQLARGISAARGEAVCHDSVMSVIIHVAKSGIPQTRLKLVEFLSTAEDFVRTDRVGQALKLGTGTVHRALEDLWTLGLVERGEGSVRHVWKLSAIAIERLRQAGVLTSALVDTPLTIAPSLGQEAAA